MEHFHITRFSRRHLTPRNAVRDTDHHLWRSSRVNIFGESSTISKPSQTTAQATTNSVFNAVDDVGTDHGHFAALGDDDHVVTSQEADKAENAVAGNASLHNLAISTTQGLNPRQEILGGGVSFERKQVFRMSIELMAQIHFQSCLRGFVQARRRHRHR